MKKAQFLDKKLLRRLYSAGSLSNVIISPEGKRAFKEYIARIDFIK